MFLNGCRNYVAQNPRHFEDRHNPILKNIQNCRNNSMNAAGRPIDSLEMVTRNEILDENDKEKNKENDELLEIMYRDMLLQNAEELMGGNTDCRTREFFVY